MSEQPGDAPRTNVNLTCSSSVVPALMLSTTRKHPSHAEGIPGPERRGYVQKGPSFNQCLHGLGHVHKLPFHFVVWIIRTSSSRSCVSWHLAQCLAHGVCLKKGHRLVKVSWETYVINPILQIKSPRLRESKANCPRSRGQYVVRLTPHHRPVEKRGVGGPVLRLEIQGRLV